MGLSGFPVHRQKALEIGSATFLATCALAYTGIRCGLPVILENPGTSMMFRAPALTRLLRRPECRSYTFTACSFGTPLEETDPIGCMDLYRHEVACHLPAETAVLHVFR